MNARVEHAMTKNQMLRVELRRNWKQADPEAQRIAAAKDLGTNRVTEVKVTPKKSDVFVKYFGVAWIPCYLVQAGGETQELRAFGPD